MTACSGCSQQTMKAAIATTSKGFSQSLSTGNEYPISKNGNEKSTLSSGDSNTPNTPEVTNKVGFVRHYSRYLEDFGGLAAIGQAVEVYRLGQADDSVDVAIKFGEHSGIGRNPIRENVAYVRFEAGETNCSKRVLFEVIPVVFDSTVFVPMRLVVPGWSNVAVDPVYESSVLAILSLKQADEDLKAVYERHAAGRDYSSNAADSFLKELERQRARSATVEAIAIPFDPANRR